MQHAIAIEQYGPNGATMAAVIESCVHCGFCLPSCPTYVTLEEEMDSPRGRVFLMKGVLEGEIELDSALPYLDNCLGCQACESACPSGVAYGKLITPFRAHAEPRRRRRPVDRLTRALTLSTLPFPRRLRSAARLGGLARPLGRLLPTQLAAMLELLPARLPPSQPLPSVHPAVGTPRARVALLAGCAQQVLAPEIGWATLRVLARNGVETVIPPTQGCCGALALHTGAADRARRHARVNLAAFPTDVDAVITNAAGCGSGMREYGLLFAGEPEADAAAALAAKVIDVSVLLADLGLVPVPPQSPPTPGNAGTPGQPRLAAPAPLRIAYQDACHLAHAQGVRDAPRALLGAIPGVELVTPADWELCCGSAGTYNVERPEIAAELGARKAASLIACGAQLIASANIGCLTQISSHLERLGQAIPVRHTIEILDAAYAGRLDALLAG